MLQEHTAIGNILAKMREVIPAPMATEIDVFNSDSPVADAVSVTPIVSPLHRADETPGLQPLISSQMLEEVFASAIRDAISPVAQRWVNSHQTELIGALGMIIRRWMDERLPELVESGLKEEFRRPSAQNPPAQN